MGTLTEAMLGTKSKPLCNLHGAETNAVLEFAMEHIGKHFDKLPNADAWQECCAALLRASASLPRYVQAVLFKM